MKKIIVILVTIFFASCTKDNDTNTQFNISNIVGKWQVVDTLAFDPDNPNGSNLDPNDHILNLKLDNTFTLLNNGEWNLSGTYFVSSDSVISLNYETQAGWTGTMLKKIRTLTDTELVLDNDLSDSGTACAEGCATMYSKITD